MFDRKIKYRLVWADEFDQDGKPDPDKWNYDIGEKWFNNESQAYTDHIISQLAAPVR